MSHSADELLRHMLDETAFLMREIAGMNMEAFLADEMFKRAAIRSLEIIGEATKSMPASYRQDHPDVPWRSMAAMRDRLIHGYFGVDYDIVWDVLQNRIPPLNAQLEKLINN